MTKVSRRFEGSIKITAEVINTKKEFRWRLVFHIKTQESKRIYWAKAGATDWTSCYASLLVHQFDDNRSFAYATAYWEGSLPIEIPFEIKKGEVC